MGSGGRIFVRYIFAFSSGSGRKSEPALNLVYLFHFISFIVNFVVIPLVENLWNTLVFTCYFCGQQLMGSGWEVCELRGEDARTCPWDQEIDYAGMGGLKM